GTLIGAGTSGSPLGIATSGVTSEKIADGTIKTADLSSGVVTSDKIANGAVTSEKIPNNAVQTSHFAMKAVTQSVLGATGGATAGKVLGTDGSNLVWQSASGFTLPYSGEASADWAFRVDNTSATGRAAILGFTGYGSAAGVRGENSSTTGEAYGVLGLNKSTTGAAMVGTNSATSGKATGVRGQTLSADGIGVNGISQAAGGGTGVQGEAPFANGVGVRGMGYNASGVGGYFTGGKGLMAISNGTGLSRVALEANSQSSSGVSFYAHQGSSDAVIVGANTGSGELIKLFSGAGGANLRFQVASSGEIHGAGSADLLRLTSGTVTSGNLRLKVTNDGNIGIDGNLFTGGIDVAEAFAVEGDVRDYEPGDVMVISEWSDATAEKSTGRASTRVAGVVATRPGVVLSRKGTDEDMSTSVPLGVLGVIPTKVTDEGGPIRRGDLLTTSSTPGHAMKATPVIVQGMPIYPTGAVLGKALQPFDGPGSGIIEVLVNAR
ncbi:MAG TPA: hypothetical protein PLS53_17080, partial [Thermoanaerobaculaceae bacterium]|nr:hypothetical protein [Thermoanaerobaculaceae bacterium]